jgi:hypothetical protein
MLTGVKPADDQVAKFAALAPVINVTGYHFIFGTWTHHSPFWAVLFCQRLPECYRVQKVSVPRAC